MKKQLFFLFALLSMAGVCRAYDFSAVCSTGQTLYYTKLTDSTVLLRGCNGNGSSILVIPATVSYEGINYTVTGIKDWAFQGCTSLTSITIPYSITHIGNVPFAGCGNMTNIQVDSDNTTYDSRNDCNAIIETATNRLIYGLASTTIPNSVEIIGYKAFSGCRNLTSINIPNSVTIIEDYAFDFCKELHSVIIPNSVTIIGGGAFEGCDSLRSVTLSNSLIRIGDAAFHCCISLTGIVIPNSVTYIGNDAFSGCIGMTSVSLGNSLDSIGSNAFAYCIGLHTITIPSLVSSIGHLAFYRCLELTSVVVEEDNTFYDSRNNCNAIIETATNTLVFGNKNSTIPHSVTRIGKAAFYFCDDLTSISIPNSVTVIDEMAFNGCTGLRNLILPNSVTRIENEAFTWCDGITSLTLSNSLTNIGVYAFSGCSGLDTIYSLNPTPATVEGPTPFGNVRRDLALLVPMGSLNTYSNAPVWCEFTNIQEAALPQRIEDALYEGVSIKTMDGQIVIDGADGHRVTLTDIQGHTLHRGTVTGTFTVDVPTSGVYLLQLDNRPAHKVSVVR